jgi:hypothetical protein
MSTRKDRGIKQKIFLLGQNEKQSSNIEKIFDVMGTTGRVYNVTINKSPHCTCPDFKLRKKRCKHIYFVLIRIMNIQEEKQDNQIYSDDELEKMFSFIQNLPGIVAEKQYIDQYDKLKNKSTRPKREITQEDICAICLDYYCESDLEISYCNNTNCGFPVHAICFDQINKKNRTPQCIICKCKWKSNGEKLSYNQIHL